MTSMAGSLLWLVCGREKGRRQGREPQEQRIYRGKRSELSARCPAARKPV